MPTKKVKSNSIATPPSAERSAIMRAVKSKNTKPEKIVRSLLHRLGFRFRLHRRDLPGRPDIYLKRQALAIFVHGCFWHRHPGCKHATTPKSNAGYWNEKFKRNQKRDRAAKHELEKSGIKVLILWECEISKGEEYLKSKLALRCY